MITIDENSMTIKVETTLSFDKNVVPYINDLKTDMHYDIEHDVDNSLFDDDEKMKIKKFLDYELKKEDKKNILDKILDQYEFATEYIGANIEIFDEDIITKALKDWIEEKFGFEY